MTWYQFKLKLDNSYLLDTKHVLHHNNHNKLCTFFTKRIKADILKEFILSIELNLSVVEPYFFENEMVAFEMKVKKQDQDHSGRISRVGPININEIGQNGEKQSPSLKVIISTEIYLLHGTNDWQMK